MIDIPPFHIPTKYEGYYYNVQDKQLYSSKIGNELRKIKRAFPAPWNKIHMPGFYISVKGRRRFVPVSYLRSLTIFDTIIKTGK